MGLRYRDRGTALHRQNPLCMLAWAASLLVLALMLDSPLFLLLLVLATLPLVAAGRVWREWASFMRFAPYMCVAIIAINALVSYHGTHVLLQAPFSVPVMGTPTITLEALAYGAAMCLRLVAIVSAFAILTFTVHPDDMMLSAMKVRLPYKSVLVTSLSTRFIPTLMDDARRITDVQRSRGLELDRGRLPRRVRNGMSVIIPLLSNSLDRTVQVAEAMEARAFGSGTGRTFYRDIGLSGVDALTLVAALSPLALGIFLRAAGCGDYQYYPTLGEVGPMVLEWPLAVAMVALLSAIVPLAFLKREGRP
ncbi:MAG: energy-coupling factor transporter transmembrane component T [Chloroflexota bacterium]|nr:energy-coupling factor transporter transmembrane component T [Chloroflexota bacterium]